MADEIMTQEFVESPQASGGSGGFFEDFQLVDDSGNPVSTESDPAGEQDLLPTEKSGTPQEQKPAQGEGGTKQEQKPSVPKTSFEKRFFKAGDDGKERFDTDNFVDFLQNRQPPQFQRQQSMQQQAPQPQAQPQQLPPKEPENPYLARVKERQEYRKNLMAPAEIYDSAYAQARQAGYDEAQSRNYARQQWQQKVEEQAAYFEATQEEEWARKQGEAEESKRKAVEYRTSRFQNESMYAKEFGTVDDFREFVIGRVEGNQLVGGYANDVMWAFYNSDNPNNPNPTQEQFLGWYDRFASQPEKLHALYEVAHSRMIQRQWPNVVKRIQAGQQQMQQQQKVSKTSRPGTHGNAPIGGSSVEDPLGGFMMPINTV